MAGAFAALIQAAASHYVRSDLYEPAATYDVLAAPVADPLIHIVLLPLWFFLAYALVQILGFRGVLHQLERDRRSGRRRGGDRRDRLSEHLIAAAGRPTDSAGDAGREHELALIEHRLLRPVALGIGALTMLGLLGTVIGLSLALQDLAPVMGGNANPADTAAVLSRLGLAFTTTLIGITGSLVLSVVRMILRMSAEELAARLGAAELPVRTR